MAITFYAFMLSDCNYSFMLRDKCFNDELFSLFGYLKLSYYHEY